MGERNNLSRVPVYQCPPTTRFFRIQAQICNMGPVSTRYMKGITPVISIIVLLLIFVGVLKLSSRRQRPIIADEGPDGEDDFDIVEARVLEED